MIRTTPDFAEVGLVTRRRDGYWVVYGLAPERMASLSAALDRYLGTS